MAGELDGWTLSDFKVYRRNEDELSQSTLYNQMTVLRKFIRWCESRNLVDLKSGSPLSHRTIVRRFRGAVRQQ
jgi:hypothetical protein